MEKNTFYEELLNLPSVEILDIKVDTKIITIECQVKQLGNICPNCGETSTTVNQYYHRTIRDLNMGIRHVHLSVKMRQFYCKDCNRYFTETLDFTNLNKEYTHRQRDYMFILAHKQRYTEWLLLLMLAPKLMKELS